MSRLSIWLGLVAWLLLVKYLQPHLWLWQEITAGTWFSGWVLFLHYLCGPKER
jgi:hypothetical protein